MGSERKKRAQSRKWKTRIYIQLIYLSQYEKKLFLMPAEKEREQAVTNKMVSSSPQNRFLTLKDRLNEERKVAQFFRIP